MNIQKLNSNTDMPLMASDNQTGSTNILIDPSNPNNSMDNIGYRHNKMLIAFRKVEKIGVRLKENEYANYYMKLIENLDVSNKAKDYLKILGNTLSNASSYTSFKNDLVALENQINNDVNIHWSERKLLLSTIYSIARYSSSLQVINQGRPSPVFFLTYSTWADLSWIVYDMNMGYDDDDIAFDSTVGSALLVFAPL